MGARRQHKRSTERTARDFERLVDVEARTGISGAEFRKLWGQGLGPRRFKLGRMVLLRRLEVDAWIEAHAVIS